MPDPSRSVMLAVPCSSIRRRAFLLSSTPIKPLTFHDIPSHLKCLVLAVAMAACGGAALAQSSTLPSPPTSPAAPNDNNAPLTARVRAFDEVFFTAFNTCDLAALQRLVSPDLEFFHDLAGTSRTREKFLASVKENVCGKFTRALLPGTLEVWPLGKEGAIYSGSHRFCHAAKTGCQGEGRFLHVLEERDGRLLLLRVVSYDHRPVPAGAGGGK